MRFAHRVGQNARLIAELAKFGLLSTIVTFRCLNDLVTKFTPASVEVLSVLLEAAGRFLLQNPDTNVRLQHVVRAFLCLGGDSP